MNSVPKYAEIVSFFYNRRPERGHFFTLDMKDKSARPLTGNSEDAVSRCVDYIENGFRIASAVSLIPNVIDMRRYEKTDAAGILGRLDESVIFSSQMLIVSENNSVDAENIVGLIGEKVLKVPNVIVSNNNGKLFLVWRTVTHTRLELWRSAQDGLEAHYRGALGDAVMAAISPIHGVPLVSILDGEVGTTIRRSSYVLYKNDTIFSVDDFIGATQSDALERKSKKPAKQKVNV